MNENARKDALKARIVQPGIAVFAKTNYGKDFVLNLCQSKAVAAPTDPLNVPVLMSELRTWENQSSKSI